MEDFLAAPLTDDGWYAGLGQGKDLQWRFVAPVWMGNTLALLTFSL